MRSYRRWKWMVLAGLAAGTAAQLATCQQELALLGLRTAFSAFTLPINEAIRQYLLSGI